nr:hypothetical protein [Tanacetum cinerariifolium]
MILRKNSKKELFYLNLKDSSRKDIEAKYNKVKAKLALLSSSALASKAHMVSNEGLIAEAYEWDEEEVSSDNNETVEVKVLMALTEKRMLSRKNAVDKENARNSEWIKIFMRKCDIKKPIWYLDGGCSRYMTGFKSYLHKYAEQPGPKVVFEDDSTCTTKGYGSIKCNGIVFTMVAFVNGLKYNLISTRKLCDAKYIIQFDEKRGTIFNSNKEIVMISPRKVIYPMNIFILMSLLKDQNDQSVQNDEILNNDHSEHSNHTNDEKIIDNLLNTKDIQISEHVSLSSPNAEDTLVQNTTIPSPPLPVPSMVTPAPQDRWSQDKHIKLANIIDFLSKEEPKKVFEELKNTGWVDAMQDELNQFSRNKVWTLVPTTYGKTIIGSRWVFKNKRDETRILIENKARLEAQGCNQREGIDYDETFSPLARLEAIRIFLAFSTYVNFLVCQMDVKSSFLKVKTPMVPPNNLGPNLNDKVVNNTQYRASPKESHRIDVKRIFKYLKGTHSLGLWYPKCLGFNLKGYSDFDYAGCNMDTKSTSAKAKYVVAVGCCANILWMKSQLTEYDIIYEKVPIFCDNTSAIAISNNPFLHLRTKHIEIIYHFIRDHILKWDIELHFIPTQYQLADMFTKPLDEPTFKRLIVELGSKQENKRGNGRTLERETSERKLVPSCFMIFDLEPLSLSFDFVVSSEICKSLSFSLDRLCHLLILCLE